jgi:hypothetical protein
LLFAQGAHLRCAVGGGCGYLLIKIQMSVEAADTC